MYPCRNCIICCLCSSIDTQYIIILLSSHLHIHFGRLQQQSSAKVHLSKVGELTVRQ